jgi:hypothetical protein
MVVLTTLGLVAAASVAVVHGPHGCSEAAHDVRAACSCVDYSRSYAASAYYYSQFSTYRRPSYHPRPYPVRPTYAPPPSVYAPPPPYHGAAPAYVVRGRPVQAQGPVGYIQGPTVYVDAPPVYVEPAQIYVERPEIVVRPSEVIVAPPQIHFEPCPDGEICYQDPATQGGTTGQGD